MRNNILNLCMLLVVSLLLFSCDDNSGSQQSFRQIVEEEFMESDTDQNGVISGSEIDATIQNDFNRMDINMNGVITATDHVGSEYLTEFNGEALDFDASNRGELNDDTYDDEVLTLEEYSNSVEDNFIDLADSNDDGQISLEEVLDFHFGPNPGDG